MKQNLISRYVLLPVVAVILIIVSGFVYTVDIRLAIWNQSVSDIYEMTKQGSHALDVYLSKNTGMLHQLTLNFSQLNSTDVDTIKKDIQRFKGLESDYFVINLEDSVLYSNHNTEVIKLSEEENKFSSAKGCIVNEPSISNFTGLRVMSIYENFRFADGTKGIIKSEYPISGIREEIAIKYYNESGYVNIVNSDGKILIRSDNRESSRTYNNIFDAIDINGNDKGELQIFKNAIASGKSGAAHFEFNNKEFLYTYVPIESADGWYFVSIIPVSVIMNNSEEGIINTITFLTLVTIGVILVIVFIFMITNNHGKRARKKYLLMYREKVFNILVSNAEPIYIILNADDFSVEYVSNNVENVLGVPLKTVKGDIVKLGAAYYSDGRKIDFNFLRDIEENTSVALESTRIHSVSGACIQFTETIHRITVGDIDEFIIVISDKSAKNKK